MNLSTLNSSANKLLIINWSSNYSFIVSLVVYWNCWRLLNGKSNDTIVGEDKIELLYMLLQVSYSSNLQAYTLLIYLKRQKQLTFNTIIREKQCIWKNITCCFHSSIKTYFNIYISMYFCCYWVFDGKVNVTTFLLLNMFSKISPIPIFFVSKGPFMVTVFFFNECVC